MNLLGRPSEAGEQCAHVTHLDAFALFGLMLQATPPPTHPPRTPLLPLRWGKPFGVSPPVQCGGSIRVSAPQSCIHIPSVADNYGYVDEELDCGGGKP